LLVDSPRAARPLFARLDELGGARRMFLTHRDDVADHARFHAVFGCERILHAADVGAGTRDVERRLDGVDPVRLDDDLLAIPVPGHTRGSTALLYRETFLFTGDHLWGDEDTGRLGMSRSVCWYSWREQVASLRRLLDHRFEWVLPGHGRRFRAPSARAMRAAVETLLAEC
jgi:glyoxylase-like metal-dependent hydrolase (beta-lactamase superfamily II)